MKANKLRYGFRLLPTLIFSTIVATNLQADNLKKDSQRDSAKERVYAVDKMTEALSLVKEYYVDDLSLLEIVDKAIAGLLQNLDAHSSYMDEKSFKDTKIQTEGEFGGLGITVSMKDGALTVVAPIEGTPADKAGIKSNDVILRIDGNSTIGITLDEAVNKMRGKPKTPITVTIVRKGQAKPFDVKIIRDIIKVESVYSKIVDKDNILYIRVTNFDKKVTQEVKKIIQKNKKVKGIVLDLRNNPGGLLDQAVGLTNLFVKSGTIVSQKGKKNVGSENYNASPKNHITDLPMAVLVNGGSASASEIVTGALQDFKRAVVVGEKTFGKGSVQMIIPLMGFDKKQEGIKLTIAKYYLPSGRTIQAVGIEPDILVYPGEVPHSDSNFSIKESDLKKHLESELSKIENGSEKKQISNVDSNATKDIITQEQIFEDIQLKIAIDAVKILNIKK